MRVVVRRLDEGDVGRFVEPGAGRAHGTHPAGPRRTDADHVAANGLVEDVVAVDVRIEKDRARDDGHRPDIARVRGPALVRLDARKRRRYVLRDVDGVDGPDPCP